ncbi:DUF1007 family protein [Maridesulfovibrio zosterae]|uniref:DUF1007 family protein n=1 Tax=Maridesulfovibrio zosterae TaxID=82171 RepID=UPI00041CE9CA|nr:DUF1007 family protein [Maridesulfovibrio zosterae]
MKVKIKHLVFKSGITLLILLTMVSVLSVSQKAQAHPHVFVDCSLTFEFDADGLKGIRQKWWFDEMFATMILGDFDQNHDNILTPQEAKELEQGAFINLKNFDYFTHIYVDGLPIKSVDATEFKPTIEDSTLVYNFFVPLKISKDKRKHVAMVAIYDESFYTSFQMDPKNKLANQPAGYTTTLNLEPVPDMAYFHSQIIPEAVIFTMLPQ